MSSKTTEDILKKIEKHEELNGEVPNDVRQTLDVIEDRNTQFLIKKENIKNAISNGQRFTKHRISL